MRLFSKSVFVLFFVLFSSMTFADRKVIKHQCDGSDGQRYTVVEDYIRNERTGQLITYLAIHDVQTEWHETSQLKGKAQLFIADEGGEPSRVFKYKTTVEFPVVTIKYPKIKPDSEVEPIGSGTIVLQDGLKDPETNEVKSKTVSLEGCALSMITLKSPKKE